MTQEMLIDKTERARRILDRIKDKIIFHEKPVPSYIEDMYEEILDNIDSINTTIYRANDAEVLEWCDELINGTKSNIIELYSVTNLYVNSYCSNK